MTNKQITIGSLFSGIGGFELGLERAIPNSKTIWQCEQNAFAQKVLKKHWPDVPIYDDIKEIKRGTINIVDIICGGFPCQDISLNNPSGKGLKEKRAGYFTNLQESSARQSQNSSFLKMTHLQINRFWT